MKIYAPVKDAWGTWASVRFVNGVGETDDPSLIEWFRRNGYTLEENVITKRQRVERAVSDSTNEIPNEIVGEANGGVTDESADQPDLDNMTPYELREWMKDNGYGLKMKGVRSKEKLLAIIRG